MVAGGGSASRSELRRGLKLPDAIGIGLGSIIGAGLFVVVGIAAGVSGPALLIGLAVAGLGATCNALSSADLAAKFPQSGGTYEYANRLLDPWLGFSAGWTFLASKLAAGGTVALGFGSYVAKLVPDLDPRWAGVAAALVLTGANHFGIKRSGRLNLAIVFVTLAALAYFAASTLPAFDASHFQPFAPRGALPILEAAALLFFAFTGYARLATLGEEVIEPERTIPRAAIASISLAFALYVVVITAALGSIGAPAMAESGSPLEAAGRRGVLVGTPLVVVVGGCTGMLGVLLSQVLGISRMMFAMARGRDLPAFLGRTNPHDIPHWAVLATGATLLAITWFGKLAFVPASASFAILLYYGITNLAALRLPTAERRFRRWVAWLGLGFRIAMGLSLPPPVMGSGLAVLAFGLGARWLALLFGRANGRGGNSALAP